jgi:hypothetical protein
MPFSLSDTCAGPTLTQQEMLAHKGEMPTRPALLEYMNEEAAPTNKEPSPRIFFELTDNSANSPLSPFSFIYPF